MVDADRGVAIVVGAHFELRAGARGVLQDLGEGFVARHVDGGPVFRQDAVPSPEDEDPLGWGVAAKDRGLQDAIELHRPKLGEDGPNRFGPAVGDPLHAPRRDFHREYSVIVTIRRFPRNSISIDAQRPQKRSSTTLAIASVRS